MRIVVVGGGKVGYYLVKILVEQGHKVSLVEMDDKRCQLIAEEMDILSVKGDGTEINTLVDAGADTADVIVAATGKDEVNLVICQIAKRFLGVKRAVTRVNNPKNREVLKMLGVDIVVSGTDLIINAIEEIIQEV
ncbi:MAG: potassium channel family protein [bacterium]